MRYRRFRQWIVATILTVALLVVAVGCDNLFGGGSSGSGNADVQLPTGNTTHAWVADISGFPEGERPGPNAIADVLGYYVDDSGHARLVFYVQDDGHGGDGGIYQFSGFAGPVSHTSDSVTISLTYFWVGEDPGGDVPGFNWDGMDWYQFSEPPPDTPSSIPFPINDDGELVMDDPKVEDPILFEPVTFSIPDGLVGEWKHDNDDLILNADGSLSFTWDDGVQHGSGRWEASGPDGDSQRYFRQIYTNISDDEDVKEWEHLNPYNLTEGNLTIYWDLDMTSSIKYTQ